LILEASGNLQVASDKDIMQRQSARSSGSALG